MMTAPFTRLNALALVLLAGIPLNLRAEQLPGQAVEPGPDGKLVYESDSRGNRVPDFSHAGFGGGGIPIPEVPAVVRVPVADGDDTDRLQAAINYVSRLPLGSNGVRGAVQLEAGRYTVSGQLLVEASGVVLRGAGCGEGGTEIVATGTGRRTLIRFRGVDDRYFDGPSAIIGEYVPAGSMELPVDNAKDFQAGDRVVVGRPSTAGWIEQLGMDTSPGRTPYRWKPGTVDLEWDRRIVKIDTGVLFLDAPITTALDPGLGGGTVRRYEWPGRIRNCGLEGMVLVSAYDEARPKDEDHAWMAVEMDALEDGWIRDIVGRHFVSSIVDLGAGTRAVSVLNCASLQPVSEDGGYRRHAFSTSGQLTLFFNCQSEFGRCDFTAGYMAPGPNVFLDCRSRQSTDLSGSVGSWSSGLLFDNVHIDGGSLGFDNLEIRYGGVGWAAAESVLWQCSASRIIVRSPPGSVNRGIGVWGEFYGDGAWYKVNEFVTPQSLYLAQLYERCGSAAGAALESFSPPGEIAEVVTLAELAPQWRELLPELPAAGTGLRIHNGWIVDDNGLMTGRQSPTSWWRGHLIPSRTGDHPPSITRFLPGRYGAGATMDLEQLARQLEERNEIQIRHHWGLWYDRRREDHQMIRRMDGDVWPPFYEQPFIRSGLGTAWDGLSRYDLTRFNPWYFQRLREFSEAAARHGRLLVNEMYFQHNIIESGAHWVDYPWRPVNNIQGTRFPEPPPFKGDTIHIGNLFYDVNEDWLRKTHVDYIRHSLENLSGQGNVIHTTGDEYTGPLSFVEFWLDTVGDWVAEGNPDPVIALSTTKDVQDAILQDPVRSKLVDVVEFKYWFNTDKGLYAPKGGEELAPRQHLRKWKGGQSSARDVANMIRDYRREFPDKAVIVSEIGGMDGWAMLAAGGSLAPVPKTMEVELRKAVAELEIVQSAGRHPDSQWILGDGDRFLACALPGAVVRIEPDGGASFRVREVNLNDGKFKSKEHLIPANERIILKPDGNGPAVYWITRNTPSDK